MVLRGVVIGLVLALPLLAAAADVPVQKNRLLMLVAEGVNGNEFMVPFEVGRAAGYEFDLARPAKVTLLEKNAARGAPKPAA